jgi:hypothetical protein
MLYDPLPNMQWTSPAMVGATRVLIAPVVALVAAPVAALDDVFVVAPVAPVEVLGLLEEWQHARPVPPLSNVIRLYLLHCLYEYITVKIMSTLE